MARCSLKYGPSWSCGMVDGLATASCVSLVDVGSIKAPLPGSPGVYPDLFSLACGYTASQRLPGMEMLSGRKWTIVSVRVHGIISVHLTGSSLVFNASYILVVVL